MVGGPGSNLADWTPIATNVLGTDPQSAQFPQRFYCVLMP